ncbi:MAG: hypothetical protein K6T63_03155 [Alicyclobacillus herbarius]|uniref:hypothetical protein n=1 Tax=Alicyclobacillus herbarius TaxID=122960 RepID=UPI0004159E76|nr:hypothetical protein [Alicyclobacillus herbarius]MCL6631605.1 hypothetical protein [Alicyclobacillus herbarius]
MQFGNGSGVWRGWHLKTVGLTVISLVVLQLIAKYAVHYPLLYTVALAEIIACYFIVPRVKERTVANALAGAIALFVINMVLQFELEWPILAQVGWRGTLLEDGFALLIGLVWSVLYFRLNAWSERKRLEAEEKRRKETVTEDEPTPPQRGRSPYTRKRQMEKRKRKQRR